MSRTYIIALVLLFCTTAAVQAQQTIRGFVLDQQTREPLIGATVMVPNTTTGTSTNREGHFELEVPGDAEQVRISYIGYIPRFVELEDYEEPLNIRMQPDNIALNEVQVVGFDTNRRLQETSASVSLITAKDFERTNEMSLKPVLNTVPGVQMDQSTLGDARISIRGAGIRSGFGTRNIKLYVNSIPLTEADGFTRIEGLDVSAVGRAEVLKGPASSIYGAGTGGVINFQLEKAPYGGSSLEAGSLVGSYGLNRLSTTYRTGSDEFNTVISAGSQNYDGYREHSSDERRFFTGSLQFFPSREQSLTLLMNRSRQESLIPGDLSAAQVEEDPRQASSGNLLNQAGRFQSWTRIGASHSYTFSDYMENTTSVYTSFYDMNHPLPFAYLRQPYQSYGGRTRFVIEPAMEVLPTVFTFGGEYLNGRTDAKRYVNEEGEEGALIHNQILDNTQYTLFYQAETSLTDQTILTLGLSLNRVRYDIQDFLNESFSGVKDFDPVLAPRIGLSHVFSEQFALRGGISSGFSPPTTSELTDADGRISRQLQAEKGINYEIGARGNLLGEGLNYDLALFSFQMEDQLVPQTVGPGNTIFVNAGETSRRGLEAAISWFWSNESAIFLTSIRPFLSYTYSDFTFIEFTIQDSDGSVQSDYSGNDVTGISPHRLSAGLDIKTAPGFYLNTTYQFRDRTPLNDANTVYQEAYSVWDTKAGLRTEIGGMFRIDLNAGINNMLDTSHSSHAALNASSFGGAPPAYYNPAPGRNFYAGLTFGYMF